MNWKYTSFLLALLTFNLSSGWATAQEIDTRAIAKARALLNDNDRASVVQFFVYPTTKLTGFREYDPVAGVKGADGRGRPGWFCLSYRYRWEGLIENGHTDLVYVFNPAGRLSAIQVEADSAATGTPFTDCDAVLRAVKNQLEKEIAQLEDPVVKDLLSTAVRRSDARLILTGMLMANQSR